MKKINKFLSFFLAFLMLLDISVPIAEIYANNLNNEQTEPNELLIAEDILNTEEIFDDELAEEVVPTSDVEEIFMWGGEASVVSDQLDTQMHLVKRSSPPAGTPKSLNGYYLKLFIPGEESGAAYWPICVKNKNDNPENIGKTDIVYYYLYDLSTISLVQTGSWGYLDEAETIYGFKHMNDYEVGQFFYYPLEYKNGIVEDGLAYPKDMADIRDFTHIAADKNQGAELVRRYYACGKTPTTSGGAWISEWEWNYDLGDHDTNEKALVKMKTLNGVTRYTQIASEWFNPFTFVTPANRFGLYNDGQGYQKKDYAGKILESSNADWVGKTLESIFWMKDGDDKKGPTQMSEYAKLTYSAFIPKTAFIYFKMGDNCYTTPRHLWVLDDTDSKSSSTEGGRGSAVGGTTSEVSLSLASFSCFRTDSRPISATNYPTGLIDKDATIMASPKASHVSIMTNGKVNNWFISAYPGEGKTLTKENGYSVEFDYDIDEIEAKTGVPVYKLTASLKKDAPAEDYYVVPSHINKGTKNLNDFVFTIIGATTSNSEYKKTFIDWTGKYYSYYNNGVSLEGNENFRRIQVLYRTTVALNNYYGTSPLYETVYGWSGIEGGGIGGSEIWMKVKLSDEDKSIRGKQGDNNRNALWNTWLSTDIKTVFADYFPGSFTNIEEFYVQSNKLAVEYEWASWTAKAMWCLSYFAIIEGCGDGLTYGQLMWARRRSNSVWYSAATIGRCYIEVPTTTAVSVASKDILVDTPLAPDSDEESLYYATSLWAPPMTYDEETGELTGDAKTWKELTQAERCRLLQQDYATKEAFLAYFDPVQTSKNHEVTGEPMGTLEYEYPYVIRSGMQMRVNDEFVNLYENADDYSAVGITAQPARNDIFAQYKYRIFCNKKSGEDAFADTFASYWNAVGKSTDYNSEEIRKLESEVWRAIDGATKKMDAVWAIFGPPTAGSGWYANLSDGITPFANGIWGKATNHINHMNETWTSQNILPFDGVLRGFSLSSDITDKILFQDRIWPINLVENETIRIDGDGNNSINETMTNTNIYTGIFMTPKEEDVREKLKMDGTDMTPIYVGFKVQIFDPIRLTTNDTSSSVFSIDIFDSEKTTGQEYIAKGLDMKQLTQKMFAEILIGTYKALNSNSTFKTQYDECKDDKARIELIASTMSNVQSGLSVDGSGFSDKQTIIKSGLPVLYLANRETIQKAIKENLLDVDKQIEVISAGFENLVNAYLNDNTDTKNDSATIVYQFVPPKDPPTRNLRFTETTIATTSGGWSQTTPQEFNPSKGHYSTEITISGDDESLVSDYKIDITEIFELVNDEEQIEGYTEEQKTSFSEEWDLDIEIDYSSFLEGAIASINNIDVECINPSTNKKLFHEETAEFTAGKSVVIPMKEIYDWMLDPEKNTERYSDAYVTVTITIPEKYAVLTDASDPYSADNLVADDWEKITVTFAVSPDVAGEDNEITSCELFDTDGNSYGKYVREGDAWIAQGLKYLDLDPDKRYYAEVAVTRLVTDPQLDPLSLNGGSTEGWSSPAAYTTTTIDSSKYLSAVVDSGGGRNELVYGTLENGVTQLSSNGDSAVYKIESKYNGGWMGINSLAIEINAFFAPKDSSKMNNYADGSWEAGKPFIWTMPGIDYVVHDFTVTPETAMLECEEPSNNEIEPRFTGVVSILADGVSSEHIPTEDVVVSVWMYEKKLTDADYPSYGRRVYYEEVTLNRNGAQVTLSGQLGLNATADNPGTPITFKAGCAYRFIMLINGGNGTRARVAAERRFPGSSSSDLIKGEMNYYNNESYGNIAVDNSTLCKGPTCSSSEYQDGSLCYATSNIQSENLRNDWVVDTFKFAKTTKEVWYTCCKAYNSKGNCTSWCTKCCCYSTNIERWEVTVAFWETLTVNMYYRSQEDPDWHVISPGTVKEIRAGHWYELKIKTVYATNRNYDTPTPDPYSYCLWLTRTPGRDDSNGRRTTIVEMNNPAGGQTKQWKWTRSGKVQDIPIQRFEVPENTRNITITYDYGVAAFWGTRADIPRWKESKMLCYDCRRITIKVVNPSPIVGGSTEII